MASRVNVKFVIMLAAALGFMAAGVGGVAVWVSLKSGKRNVALGDAAMAEGDYAAAERFYAKAVNKEQSNVEWLNKWRDAMTRKVPETQTRYAADYQLYAGAILKALATAQRTDIGAHREYLEEFAQRVRYSAPSPRSWEALISETELALRFFAEPPGQLARYRGIGIVNLMALGENVPPERRRQAEIDLTNALDADPADGEAAAALVMWHSQHGMEIIGEFTDAGAEHFARGREIAEKFAAANPEDPHGALALLRVKAMQADRAVPPGASPGEVVRNRRAAFAKLAEDLARAVDALATGDANRLDAHLALNFRAIATVLDPARADEHTLRLIDHALTVRPEDADLILVKGSLAHDGGRFEEAIALFQKINDMPMGPISFEGMRMFDLRAQAAARQAEAAMGLVNSAEGPDGRTKALERVKGYRAELAKHVPETAPPLMLLDAKIALTESDLNRAHRLLVEYNQKTDQGDPEALRLLGYLSLQVGQQGTARTQFMRLIELQPGATYAMLALGQIDMLEQKYGDAVIRFQSVLDLDPDNEEAKRNHAAAVALRDGKSADPIVDVLVRANDIQRGNANTLGDDTKAMAVLEEGIATHGPDPRLVAALASVKLMMNDRDGAVAVLAAGESKHPNNPLLQSVRQSIENSGSFEAVMRAIDASDAPEATKEVQRYRALRQNGQVEAAQAALARAAKLAPDDPSVIEFSFGEALGRSDYAEANRIAAQAAKLDLDRADGRTYQARILAAQRHMREAAELLQQAVEKRTATAPTLRLLAILQLELGRTTDALRSFELALGLNPTDLDTIKLYINGLRQVGQTQQALAVARRSEAYGRRDREFVEALLDLEAEMGNVVRALAAREQIRQQRPDDANNLFALAGLYTHVKRWDDARKTIDHLRTQEDSLRVAELDARWHADQADFKGAHAAFVSYIDRAAQRGDQPSPAPYMALGRFMIDRGQAQAGLAAMEQAAQYQDPKTRPVDLARADALFRLGRHADAEALYRSLIDGGAETPEYAISKRLVDVLIRTDRLAEADTIVTSIAGTAGDDLPLLIQRSVIAELLGDNRRARKLADDAVAKYPTEALPFHRRAQLLAPDPTLVQDALADLDMALRVNPDFVPARRLKASLLFSLGRQDDALNELRAAVESDPTLDDLRISLLTELLRLGREGDAVDLAERGWRLRPGDARLAVTIGDVFAQAGRWNRAAGFYKSAFEQFREAHTASRYVLAILKTKPPLTAEAEAVLGSPDLKVEQTPVLLMARALLRRTQGRTQDAELDMAAAFLGCGTDASQLGRWYEAALEVYPERAQLVTALKRLQIVDPNQTNWRDFFVGQTMLVDPSTRDEGVSTLLAMSRRAEDPSLLRPTCRLLSPALYSLGRFEECVEVTRRGLELNPDDADLNNNLAYILAQNLKNPREALAYAEKAAALAPKSVTVLDTLGAVQLALGQVGEADATLTRALSLAASPADKATVLLRLAAVKLGAGNAGEARRLVGEAETILAADPRLMEANRTQLEQLKRQIEGR